MKEDKNKQYIEHESIERLYVPILIQLWKTDAQFFLLF